MVKRMKYFFTGSVLSIIILILYIAYQQDTFTIKHLPYDDEQVGLDDQIFIYFSHVVAENTPKGMAAKKFAELAAEKSDGRIIVKVFPDGMLYNDSNELEALLENKIQMIAPTTSKMAEVLPSWQVLDLPYVIETEEQLNTALNGKLSEELLKELSAIHVKGLTFWSNGFKQIVASEPIIRVDDFEGKRVRMMGSSILAQQFQLLKAEPIQTGFGDVYYEIQNHLIDAQENTISNIYSKKFYTMENYVTLSNHGIMSYAVMMNEDFWNGLNPEDQQIILQSLEEIQEWQFDQAEKVNDEYLESLLKDSTVTILELDDENKKQWKKAFEPLYELYQEEISSEYFKLLLQEIGKAHNIQNEQNEQNKGF